MAEEFDVRHRQKFLRGDIVKASKKTFPKSHINGQEDFTAIVIGSYHDLFSSHGNSSDKDFKQYSILEWPCGNRGGAWYEEEDLEFIESKDESAVHQRDMLTKTLDRLQRPH